jgi:integrase
VAEGKTPEITPAQARTLLKSREIPVRHDLAKILFEYLKAAGLENADKDTPLLRSAIRKTGKLTGRGMHPGDICQMVKRRLRDAGLPTRLSPHSFRVATITEAGSSGPRETFGRAVVFHQPEDGAVEFPTVPCH